MPVIVCVYVGSVHIQTHPAVEDSDSCKDATNTSISSFEGEIKPCDETKTCFDGTVKTDWDLEDGN